MIEIKKTFSPDGLLRLDYLAGVAFSRESAAHRFIISGPEPFTGTVTASFMRADGQCVIVAGSLDEDGRAVVTADEDCYLIPGRLLITVYLTGEDSKICIYAGLATVYDDRGSGEAASGETARTIEEMLEELLEGIDNAQGLLEDAADLLDDITDEGATQVAAVQAKGDEVLESIPSDYSTLSGDVGSLKSDVDNVEQIVKLNDDIVLPYSIYQENMFVRHAIGDLASNQVYDATDYINVFYYESFVYKRVQVTGSTSIVGMAFYDQSKTYIIGQSAIIGASSLGYTETEIRVPANAVYARFTVYHDTSTYGQFEIRAHSALTRIRDISTAIEKTAVERIATISLWSQGWIRESGANGDSANTCRNGTLVNYDVYSAAVGVKFVVKSGYKIRANEYLGTTYDTYNGKVSLGFMSGTFTLALRPDRYYRYELRKTDDSDFTPSDIPEDVLLIKYYDSVTDKLTADVAEEYDPEKTYVAGEYVMLEGVLYRCLCDIATPEAFTSKKWLETDIATEFYNENNECIQVFDKHPVTSSTAITISDNRVTVNGVFTASSTNIRMWLCKNAQFAYGTVPEAASMLTLKDGHTYEVRYKYISGTATNEAYPAFRKASSASSTIGPLDGSRDPYADHWARVTYDSTQYPDGVSPVVMISRSSTGNTLTDYTFEITMHDITDELQIAPVEHSKADENRAVGDVFWVDGILYKATAAIAAGEAITPGTNVTETSVMSELSALKALIANN